MSNHKKPTKLRVAPSNAVASIDALSQSLGYAPAVAKSQLKLLQNRATSVPVEVIKLLASIAEQHGGTIAGMPFDAQAVRDAIARAEHAHDVAKAARRLSKRAVSDAYQNLALVGLKSMGITQALERLVLTPDAEAFKEANDQIRALMRKQGRTRKVAQKPADTKTISPKAPTNGVTNGIVVQPAAPSAQPS